MSYVVTVFDQQSDLDEALEDLYANGFDNDRVVLMRNTGDFGDENIERTDVLNKPAPLFAYARPSTEKSTGGAGVASISEVFSGELSVSDETMRFYREQADDGAIIVFVETNPDEADNVYSIMDKHNPMRIDPLVY